MNYNVYEWGGISLNSEKKYSDGNGSSDGIHDFTIGSPVDFDNTVMVREPVIYIENLEEKEIELQVDIFPNGKITESIPAYNKIGDWKIKVSQNNFINDIFPYLYYEVNINLQECTDNEEYFKVFKDVNKSDLWEFLKLQIFETGLYHRHFEDFVAYWCRYVDKFDDKLNISIFRPILMNKYFHTVFGPVAPISWKRFYVIFWDD